MSQKVLVLAPFYPPNIGGAETFAENLVNALAKKYTVHVLAYTSFNAEYGFERFRGTKQSERIYEIRLRWPFKMGKAWAGVGIRNFLSIFPKMMIKAYILCKENEYRMIFCNGLISSGIGGILKERFGIRVSSILLALYQYKANKSLFSILSKRVLNRMDYVFVEGQSGKRDISPLKINKNKIKIFQHWCNQSIFRPADPGIRKNKGKKMKVLFVGRPLIEKGMHIVKQVERHLKGVEFEYIENVSYEDLPKHYQMADVVIVPSLYAEGFCRVVIESASCHCAVITSDLGSLSELVDGWGVAVHPDAQNFYEILKAYKDHRGLLAEKQRCAYRYALDNFSEDNAGVFLSVCS